MNASKQPYETSFKYPSEKCLWHSKWQDHCNGCRGGAGQAGFNSSVRDKIRRGFAVDSSGTVVGRILKPNVRTEESFND